MFLLLLFEDSFSIYIKKLKDNKLYIQAGAGIVYDSVPKNEHQEILNKAGALMAAAEDSYKFDI